MCTVWTLVVKTLGSSVIWYWDTIMEAQSAAYCECRHDDTESEDIRSAWTYKMDNLYSNELSSVKKTSGRCWGWTLCYPGSSHVDSVLHIHATLMHCLKSIMFKFRKIKYFNQWIHMSLSSIHICLLFISTPFLVKCTWDDTSGRQFCVIWVSVTKE